MDFQTRSGMELIPRPECLRLLEGQRVGRLGFVVGGQPMVLPVNYSVDKGVVVFRSGEGTKLSGALTGKVALEVDDVDVDACRGWSVVVQGVADDITEIDDWVLERLRSMAGQPCLPGRDRYVRITPSQITGRRFPAPTTSRKPRRMVLPSWVPGDPKRRPRVGGRRRVETPSD